MFEIKDSQMGEMSKKRIEENTSQHEEKSLMEKFDNQELVIGCFPITPISQEEVARMQNEENAKTLQKLSGSITLLKEKEAEQIKNLKEREDLTEEEFDYLKKDIEKQFAEGRKSLEEGMEIFTSNIKKKSSKKN